MTAKEKHYLKIINTYSRLLGFAVGNLKGIADNDIPKELKVKIKESISEIEKEIDKIPEL